MVAGFGEPGLISVGFSAHSPERVCVPVAHKIYEASLDALGRGFTLNMPYYGAVRGDMIPVDGAGFYFT